MDRLINMILRQITRRLINKGINAGINKASAMGGQKKPQPGGASSEQDRQSARQTKQAMKMMRRTTRM